jgi:hypothetical protein
MELGFRELDDLVLNLKGLVLVRALREQRGADDGELDLYSVEIERVRDRLTSLVRQGEPERRRGGLVEASA